MNLSVDSMYHSLIFVNQLLTVFVPMVKGMLLIHRMKLRIFTDEVRMSSLYQLKNEGYWPRIVDVFVFFEEGCASADPFIKICSVLHLALGLVCSLQYWMVHLAVANLAMKVEMFGSFLLGTKEEGSSGVG